MQGKNASIPTSELCVLASWREMSLVLLLLSLAACAPLGRPTERAAKSSLGCMRAALAERDFSAMPDADAHCLAAALIAWRCSATEAMLASVGKEIRDALGAGDAAWTDLAADRRGLACAKNATDAAALESCCLPNRD
jgi:hypothetical protein